MKSKYSVNYTQYNTKDAYYTLLYYAFAPDNFTWTNKSGG